MGLRLIYSAKESISDEVRAVPENTSQLVWGALFLFCLVKIPMLFVTNNPEELRDFDHFLRMASGQTAYRDFVWLYGPLSPLVYGTLLKVLPEKLLMVRILSFLFWLPATIWLSQLLIRYQLRRAGYWLGVLFVTGLSSYPSYSHNHIIPAAALVGVIFYFTRFQERRDVSDLHSSFALALVIFFSRPILMGYGVLGLWGVLFLSDKDLSERSRLALFYAGAFLGAVALFRFIYGPGLWSAFYPQPWAILETKSYPNLHYLIPQPKFFGQAGVILFLKQIRAAMETCVFYLHYFIWPTLILTLASFIKGRLEVRAAAVAAGFAVMASLDLLHYGFSDPMNEQAMWVRGQYFFAGSALSLFLILGHAVTEARTFFLRFLSLALLLIVGVWSYLPWMVGMSHLVRYPRNQFNFPALTGITTHGDRTSALEAIQFVNGLCRNSPKSVVFPQYEPGMARLLRCNDLFEKDSYLFTRMPWYVLKANETPYAPGGQSTNGEVIDRGLASGDPRIFVIQGKSPYSIYCQKPGWQTRVFGEGSLGRTVCWRD